MLRVNQIKVPIWVTEDKIKEHLIKGICHKLKINSDQIIDYDIFKRSIDSRKNELLYVYSLNVKLHNEKKYRISSNDVSFVNELRYKFPYQNNTLNTKRIAIIGLGPAGLYCAYMLAKAGFKPIVFERGKSIEQRTEDVRKFWETGVLDAASNVQFGEGGAGAFSDGKLNTLVKDKNGRNREVLKVFVEHGAPKEILYDNKPHIGTDLLVDVVKNIRNNILSLGGEINYNSYVSDFIIEEGKLVGIIVNQKEIPCDALCLAIGHSARDTFRILYTKGIPMSAKNFAVGFRVMHPQKLIDENQLQLMHLLNHNLVKLLKL